MGPVSREEKGLDLAEDDLEDILEKKEEEREEEEDWRQRPRPYFQPIDGQC